VPEGQTQDAHFGFTDVTNILAADHVAFNSNTHRRQFLKELPGFLRKFPEFRPTWAVDRIQAKASVCYPGISVQVDHDQARPHGDPPLIVWNHRWEFDKNPEGFFMALRRVKAMGRSFALAILGETFQMKPTAFLDARDEFAEEIVQWGYLPDKSDYRAWLRRGNIVVSTSIQENFGISVLEAIACGCTPLLPFRLSYPEIIPESFHDVVLYQDDDDLVLRLASLLAERPAVTAHPDLVSHARAFSWEKQIVEFDTLMDRVATT
ncbi:MAG: DUF3524 domain-containing protein, partial [Spirochaetales bacterium]